MLEKGISHVMAPENHEGTAMKSTEWNQGGDVHELGKSTSIFYLTFVFINMKLDIPSTFAFLESEMEKSSSGVPFLNYGPKSLLCVEYMTFQTIQKCIEICA